MENRLAVSLHIFLALLLLSGGMAFRMMKGSGRMGAFPLLKLAAGDGLDASALNADELRKVANEGGYADGEKFVRLFHPAFPTKVLESLSIAEAEEFINVKRSISMVGSDMEEALKNGLPWEVLPKLGINDFQGIWSRNQTEAAYEKYKHTGHIVYKLSKPIVREAISLASQTPLKKTSFSILFIFPSPQPPV